MGNTFDPNAAVTLAVEGAVTITTEEYSDLIRRKAFLEILTAMFTNNEAWRIGDAMSAIRRLLQKEEKSEGGPDA